MRTLSLPLVGQLVGAQRPHRAVRRRDASMLFEPRQLVAALTYRLPFVSQPAVAAEAGGAQASRLDRAPHRAPGFEIVAAVPESALRGQRLNVVERVVERIRVVPQPELAHSRRVDDQTAVRQENQLALGRRVPAASVPAPYRRGPLPFAAQQAVDDGRLPDAGRADQRAGPPGGQMLPQGLGRAGEQRADDVQGDLGCEGRGGRARRLGLGAEVRLVEHEHRGRAAVPDGDEIPLDPPEVEVVIETAYQEHRVDVGGDELPAGRLAGRLAGEAAAAGQHRLDGRGVPVRAGSDGDPVADHRLGAVADRAVPQPTGHLGHHLAVGRTELIEGIVGDGHAGRPQIAVSAGPKLGLEPVVPPQGF